MEILVSAFAFLRPVFFVSVPLTVAGLNAMQLAAMALMGILGACLVGHMSLRKPINLSGLDIAILLYTAWCIVGWLAYPNKTNLPDLAKWIIPPLGFLILSNLIATKQHYQRVLLALLLGYCVPIVGSTILIALGKGVDDINYWTKLARYQGVFNNPHNFGHAMVFYLMTLTLFVHLYKHDDLKQEEKIQRFWFLILLSMIPLVLFCLYKSYVRTTYLGLVVFFVIYFYQVNRRLLFLLMVFSSIGMVLAAPILSLIFFDIIEIIEGEKGIHMLGSGRLYFWKHNFEEFLRLPIDRMLVGGGIGNDIKMYTFARGDSFWDSHNDFLDVLVETGIVGMMLFLFIQILIWVRIVRLPHAVRPPFIALISSVTIMNIASNSYVSRFGVAQLFYIVVVYIGLNAVRARGARSSQKGSEIAEETNTA